MLRENKGVTLIALIITIIILIILAGISIYVGNSSIKTAKDNAKIVELDMVQHAVLERYSEYKLTKSENLLVGTKITSQARLSTAESKIKKQFKHQGDYYSLTPSDLEYLGISNSDDTYIVNYETGEVLNETRLETGTGEALYRTAN